MKDTKITATDNLDSLFENNMGLIVLLAKSFKPRDDREFEEYVQSGRIGLWKAFKNYKPELAKFTTMAWHCIRNEILREIYKHGKFTSKHESMSASVLDVDSNIDVSSIEEYLPSTITVDERTILQNRLQGLTFSEIGVSMGCSSCWANKVYTRAVKKIRESHGS
jgi:RNA polymerase sigma factor (sigma-70 family)